MSLSANEQYILELINRGRLDPLAEAARYNINLNQGLASGTIDGTSKQVVVHNAQLEDAALGHTNWMLAANRFSHTGQGGSNIFDRITDEGYDFEGALQTYGENLSWGGHTLGIDLNEQAQVRYDNLFLSAGHRTNTLNGDFREIGIAHVEGNFTQNGTTYRASMLTEVFATSGSEYFLTGVAYTDRDQNDFYGIGEGRGGVQITANGHTATTASSGGYGIGLDPDATTDVTIRAGGSTLSTLRVDLSDHNVKLDAYTTNGQWELALSGSADLGTGVGRATLLGLNDLYLVGHGGNNALFGNGGDNRLEGRGGNDFLNGRAGNDVLRDGVGEDRLVGGSGADIFVLAGDGQIDTIVDFGNGNDRIDVRAWSGVADLGDLTVVSTANGARLMSESETLVLNSANGRSLDRSDLDAGDFFFGTLASRGAPAPQAPDRPDTPDQAEQPSGDVDAITGTRGANSLSGGAQTDYIFGYRGHDVLDGKSGADMLYGGRGNDTYYIDNSGDRIGAEFAASNGGGRDIVWSSVDFILPQNIEVVRLMGSADLSAGGNAQANVLFGNTGDNFLDGGGGRDTIRGRQGDDEIIGRRGNDFLWGGAGADTFVMTHADDSGVGAGNRDVIYGFERGVDHIDLHYIDANLLLAGHQSFDFIGTDRFSGNGDSSAGELRYISYGSENRSVMAFDQDGDGRADLQIAVRGTSILTADDFILS